MPKTTTTTDESQFKFLIACIRHSNNGRVDFEEVAKECEIVTKGAAAKRYERMMKAHGIHQPQGPAGRDTGVQPLKSRLDSETPKKAAKRKRAPRKNTMEEVDVTKASESEGEPLAVKLEEDFEPSIKSEDETDALPQKKIIKRSASLEDDEFDACDQFGSLDGADDMSFSEFDPLREFTDHDFTVIHT